MKTYKLTFKDRLYFFFQNNESERINYLFPKVYKHQLNWFKEHNIRIPLCFDKYIDNYVKALIFEYEIGGIII